MTPIKFTLALSAVFALMLIGGLTEPPIVDDDYKAVIADMERERGQCAGDGTAWIIDDMDGEAGPAYDALLTEAAIMDNYIMSEDMVIYNAY